SRSAHHCLGDPKRMPGKGPGVRRLGLHLPGAISACRRCKSNDRRLRGLGRRGLRYPCSCRISLRLRELERKEPPPSWDRTHSACEGSLPERFILEACRSKGFPGTARILRAKTRSRSDSFSRPAAARAFLGPHASCVRRLNHKRTDSHG